MVGAHGRGGRRSRDRHARFVPWQARPALLAPEHKGIGVGEALFTEAKRLMPDGFTLWANSANDRARAFYERHGMTLVELGPRPDKPEQIVAHYRWTPA